VNIKSFARDLAVKVFALISLIATIAGNTAAVAQNKNHSELVDFFQDWRAFEKPQFKKNAPDYSPKSISGMHSELKERMQRLAAIDTTNWSIADKVDYHIILAEMNGLDFNIRVLRPWQRDPAFYTSVFIYQSDTPAHEGPTNHAVIELWTYEFPLSVENENKLSLALQTIPPLLEQAQSNLTGNARELWIGGIQNLRRQAENLIELQGQTEETSNAFKKSLSNALLATQSFVTWLEKESPTKTGSSGVGKENYTWHLRNVHLVPLSWEEEVSLLTRELDRAHASLRLEEARNRDLPPLKAIASPEEFEQRSEQSIKSFMQFLTDREMIPVHDFTEPALRAHTGRFVPEAERHFFQIAIHYEPTTLFTHWYHWWDLAAMQAAPHASPIRREALLYNIWDSRAEGMATGFEEMTMHAGLYDDNPRVREIVWIMLAQRAARGLGSLYAHANEFTMKEARDFHVKWTPRGWMRADLDLLGFEQLLYMRQPGYGSSYITGKYLIERLLKDRSAQLSEQFVLKEFFKEVNEAGVIPVSLIRWQLTGRNDEILKLTNDHLRSHK